MRREINSVSFVVPDRVGSRKTEHAITAIQLNSLALRIREDFERVAMDHRIHFRGHTGRFEPQKIKQFLPLDLTMYFLRDIPTQTGQIFPEIHEVVRGGGVRRVGVVSLEELPPNVKDFELPREFQLVGEENALGERIAIPCARSGEGEGKSSLITFESVHSYRRDFARRLLDEIADEKRRTGEWN